MQTISFSEHELELISVGIINLIKNAGEARKLVEDMKTIDTITSYIKELKELNNKVNTRENETTKIIVEVSGGLVTGVHANKEVVVDVLDFDTDNPERIEEIDRQWDEMSEKIHNGELLKVY